MDLISLEALGWLFVLCIVIYAVSVIIRRSVEKAWPILRTTKDGWWDDVILRAIPLIVGGLFAFLIEEYPFPTGWTTPKLRVFLGVAAGAICSWLYKILKKTLATKAGIELSGGDSGDSLDSLRPSKGDPDAS